MEKIIQKIKTKKSENREKRRSTKTTKQSSPYENAIIKWASPELVYHQRGKVWKIAMGTLFLLTVVVAFILKAWTFSLALIAFSICYFVVHLDHPQNLEVKISDLGVKVGNRKYPYGTIKSFWIFYEPGQIKTLNIKTTDKFIKDIAIQLGDQDPSIVREFLLTKVPELEGQSEKLSDIFLRLFKI